MGEQYEIGLRTNTGIVWTPCSYKDYVQHRKAGHLVRRITDASIVTKCTVNGTKEQTNENPPTN